MFSWLRRKPIETTEIEDYMRPLSEMESRILDRDGQEVSIELKFTKSAVQWTIHGHHDKKDLASALSWMSCMLRREGYKEGS